MSTPTLLLDLGGSLLWPGAFLLLSPFRGTAIGRANANGLVLGMIVKARAVSCLDRGTLWLYSALLVVFGCVDPWANLFSTLAPGDERFIFMVLVLTASGVLTWGTTLVRRRPLDRGSDRRGLLLGGPGLFSTFFLVESLRASRPQGHWAIVFAVCSAAGVILAFVAGSALWKEPLTGRNRPDVAVGVAAVALLNLG